MLTGWYVLQPQQQAASSGGQRSPAAQNGARASEVLEEAPDNGFSPQSSSKAAKQLSDAQVTALTLYVWPRMDPCSDRTALTDSARP